MTETFDKLKALLESQGTLTDDDIAKMESEHGALEDDERIWISAEVHDRNSRAGDEITLDQYVAAAGVMDSAEPGSPEYEEAKKIVEAFESAA
jgi:hypothetical protein